MRDQPEWEEDDGTAAGAGGEHGGTSTLVRISRGDRGPAVIVVVVAAFLAIALIKPWPSGGGPRPTAQPVTPAPTPVATSDPLAVIRADCQEPPGWRTFTRERWVNGSLRSWRSLEPSAVATSPFDPTIPLVPVISQVEALGFCAPWATPERPPDDATVLAWRINDRETPGPPQPEPLALQFASPTLRLPFGALYGAPVEDDLSRSALWRPGRYVFAVGAGAYQRWWAVQIEPLPPAGPGDHIPASSSVPAIGPRSKETVSPVP